MLNKNFSNELKYYFENEYNQNFEGCDFSYLYNNRIAESPLSKLLYINDLITNKRI